MSITTLVIALTIYVGVSGLEKLAQKQEREAELQKAEEEGYEVIFID